MAAVPFRGTMRTIDKRTGEPVDFQFTGSDVGNELVVFTGIGPTATAITVPAGGLEVVDLTLQGTGEDTATLQLRKGSVGKAIFLDQDLLANTTTDRSTRLQSLEGVDLEGGSQYSLVQIAA